MSSRHARNYSKDIEEVVGSAYFNYCPHTEAGMFDVPEKVEIIVRKDPRRVDLIFICPSCGELHKLVIEENPL